MTPTTILAFGLGLYLWIFVEIILHESAHLLAAKMVGFSPFALTVGKGPLLFQGRVGGLEVRFHLLPLFGLVKARPPMTGLSWKGSVFSIAGILSDTILLVLLLMLAGIKAGAPDPSQSSVLNGFFALLALYQVVIIAANLIPSEHTIEGAKIPNDGRQFVEYLTGRTSRAFETYETIVRRYDPDFRLENSWLMRGDLSMLAVHSAAEQDMAAGRYAEATKNYLRVIDQAGMHPAEKALTLDGMACIPIIRGEKSFLTDAEAWSKEAHRLFPQCKTLRGTLGSILVEKGDYADALALLMPLTSQDNDPLDRTLAACYVAKALHRQGNATEAGTWIAMAKSHGQYPDVCSRIESEFTQQVVLVGAPSKGQA